MQYLLTLPIFDNLQVLTSISTRVSPPFDIGTRQSPKVMEPMKGGRVNARSKDLTESEITFLPFFGKKKENCRQFGSGS